MFRNLFTAALAPILALGMVFATANGAYAWGHGYGYGWGGWGWGGWGYGSPYYYSTPYYYTGYSPYYYTGYTPYYTTAYTPYYTSEYPVDFTAVVPAANITTNDNAVRLNVMVPPNAQIWLDGVKTTKTGAFRQFVTPPVTPGKDYTYNVKATWTENGKPMERIEKLTVHAGDVLNLNLAQPAQSVQQPSAKPAATTPTTTE